MDLKNALGFLILTAFLSSPALANQSQNLASDIRVYHLQRYEIAGARVSAKLQKSFIQLIDKNSELTFSEKFDLAYQDTMKPGDLEKMSLEPSSHEGDFINDVHHALEIRQKYNQGYRHDAKIRRRIQNILIGSLHVLDVKIRTELDTTIDELMRVRQFLLSQGTFITKSANHLVVNDLWWDWLWLRGHNYPSDLVQLHLQKVALISKRASTVWKERLRKHSVAMAMFALKNNTQPVLGRQKPAEVALNLTNTAQQLSGESISEPVQKQLKLYLYRGLQATGQTYEASQIKKEIAMDLFLTKGWQIASSSAEPWQHQERGFFEKLWASFTQLIRSVFTFLTYGAGFIFVATPIESLLVVAAIFILAKQGESYFNLRGRKFSQIWQEHDLLSNQGWQRIPAFLRSLTLAVKESLGVAWRMFVASYTVAPVPFYSKVAASLLIFGIGLYFNSARTLVEGVVAQMTM